MHGHFMNLLVMFKKSTSWFLLFWTAFFLPINSCYADKSIEHELKIRSLLADFRKQSNAPAAVLTINYADDKISNYVSGTIKKISAKNPNPSLITSKNLFQIGSITKSFTAVIILQLEVEGKLSINDTIADITRKYGAWLPANEYKAWKNISIKQLLNMTSGIFDVTEDETFMKILATNPEKNWRPEEILTYASQHKPYFSPGMGWHYSNGAYNILGLMIEKITQSSFEKEINQRLIKKYHLTNTFYLPYNYPKSIRKRMAHGYVEEGGDFSPFMKSGMDMTDFNMSAAGPSGALVSNSIDVSRWVALVFTKRILPAQQMQELLSAVCMGADDSCQAGETLPTHSHAQGFSLGLVRIFDPKLGIIWVYFGDTPGYSSGFIWLPKEKIALSMIISATSKEGKKLLKKLSAIAKIAKE
jgi:D-alanyl-D-alanine carboxypeptidase